MNPVNKVPSRIFAEKSPSWIKVDDFHTYTCEHGTLLHTADVGPGASTPATTETLSMPYFIALKLWLKF